MTPTNENTELGPIIDPELLIQPTAVPFLNIVLFQPEIPGNTGAIGRTAVALGAKLWLVRPLGFQVDEKTLRRAGLDYWKHLNWEVADHWEDLLERLPKTRMWYFSRFATNGFSSVSYQHGDTLVFGRETAGLPESITSKNSQWLLRVPTTDKVRSLNLATTVGIAGYEMLRQVGRSN
jgi:tRNA (cytidine/uridine-2'-O-)-methyltransferase